MDRQLERSGMKRSLTPADVRGARKNGQPTVIQAIEGAHFLQGHLERVEEAYHRGLRHFGLLHDSDAPVPLGDVYTNPPRFGGLTAFGASVIKECNRLGMLIDLAHADLETTKAALKVTTRPVIVSHTGLDTQLGSDPRMAQMMRPRLVGKEQARVVADAGGLIGVWTHLADTPLDYARNVRAMVDVIGVDHVCIGTDTKQTKKVDIGWTRELWVFVNGRLVYADKNLRELEEARKYPDARCSLENGSFTLPLEAGDNEVAVAIANNFFGWD
jgi:membrane dipeptidase